MSRASAAVQSAAASKKISGGASTFPLTPAKGAVTATGNVPVWASGGTSVSLTASKGAVTITGKVPGISTAAAGNLGTPDLAAAVNTGLVLFVGGAPSGSTQAGKEQISGNALQFVNGNFTRADPDFSGWVIPQTTNVTGVIHVVRPSAWNTTVTARYAVWADVILDAVDNYNVLVSIPWNDGWAAPFVALGSSRIATGTTSNITYTPASGSLVTINGPADTWPATLGRHTIGHVRDGDTVLWFLDGGQVGGSTTGAGTAAPLWTGGSGQTQKTICFFGRNSTSAGNGLQGGLAQLRIWGGTSMPSATAMITNMTNLHNNRNLGRFTSAAQALEAVNSSATAVAMTVDSAPKQTMVNWGWGLGVPQNYGDTIAGWTNNAIPIYDRDAALIYGNLGTKIIRMNSFIPNPLELVKKAVNTYGVDHVHVTYYNWNLNATAANIGAEATRLVNELENGPGSPYPQGGLNAGMPITGVAVFNEPGGGGSSPWNFTEQDPSTVMRAVRTELNNRGHSNIELFGPEFASNDGQTLQFFSDIVSDNTSAHPNAVDAIRAGSCHSYNMGAGPDLYDDRLFTVNKAIWQSELGNGNWNSVASRVLSDLNNGVASEVFHMGHHDKVYNLASQISQALIQFDGTPNPWYTAFRLAAQAFPRDTIMRTVTSNWSNQGIQSGGAASINAKAVSRGWYTYGTKPAICYCSGKRTDGTFRLAVFNATYGTDFFEGTETLDIDGTPTAVSYVFTGHFHAQTIQVTVTFSELSNVNGTWTGFRAIPNGSTTTVSYPLVNGQLRMTLASQDLIVLGG